MDRIINRAKQNIQTIVLPEGKDQRIIDAAKNNDEIHLFFRDVHHSPFIYHGQIQLQDYQVNDLAASEFIFRIGGAKHLPDILEDIELHKIEFKTLDKTEQESVVKSRIGQGAFRENLIKLWGCCAVTGVKNLSLLKASHIKPWRDSTNQERLDRYNGFLLTPNLDELFDAGFITFDPDGLIKVSKELTKRDRLRLHVTDGIRVIDYNSS
ncbi:MAG: HNH endonuclease [Cyclobacteriaceae bacterium]|nr:HNH endonuclease [Cyclobacteriaceae bacterium]